MAQGKFEEAKELVETLDDSLLELREWPGEEESDKTEEKNSQKARIVKNKRIGRRVRKWILTR